jgi:hypothetical protein
MAAEQTCKAGTTLSVLSPMRLGARPLIITSVITLPTLDLFFYLEDGGRRFLKNAGNNVPHFTASRPRIIFKKTYALNLQ